jgi:hypothetical protein
MKETAAEGIALYKRRDNSNGGSCWLISGGIDAAGEGAV